MQTTVLIRGVDYVLLCSPDPEGQFGALTRDLGFPVDWKLARYEGFTTDGGFLGNMNLGLILFEEMLSESDNDAFKFDHLRFCEIAIRPRGLADAPRFIEALGFPTGKPETFLCPNVRPTGSAVHEYHRGLLIVSGGIRVSSRIQL